MNTKPTTCFLQVKNEMLFNGINDKYFTKMSLMLSRDINYNRYHYSTSQGVQ